MIVAVLKESFPGEQRVALVPAAVPSLTKVGVEVLVETGAGVLAGYSDEQFIAKGAKVTPNRTDLFQADCLLSVRTAGANPEAGKADLGQMRKGQMVIGMADPLGDPQAVSAIAQRGVSLFALELMPRITRAQSMDVLSAMATVAGYRAVLLGALALPKMFPMMM
ncbi:MAG: NAD(P)(+) transhydrogenase (Re/Si-specific) subunit alpha, partial [Patescibacteria group bacterium]|nr:NAD(P)(+) transhydrogenase (Re/Si-specific) subunit alpha [Patescibacteria group bacterium]